MTKFKYDATTTSGKRARGVTEATSVRSAMAVLVDEGLDVREIKEKRSALQFEVTRKKLPQAELMHFSRQLAAFVRAGIPLVEALQIIEEETEDKTLRKVLAGVQESLIAGDTFSAALTPYETLFPQFYIDMIRAAELTGRLDDVLDELSRYIKRDLDARSKVKSALTYPAIILLCLDRHGDRAGGLRASPIQGVLRVAARDPAAADAHADRVHRLPAALLVGDPDRLRTGRVRLVAARSHRRADVGCGTRSCSRCR